MPVAQMPSAPERWPPTKISSRCGKDADPDIPILKETKTEYTKLQFAGIWV
jgi:hypothetical protein